MQNRITAAVMGAFLLLTASFFIGRWTITGDTESEISTPVVLAASVPNTPEKPSDTVSRDRVYKTVPGDTLWKISEREYGGRGYLYPLLAEVNKIADVDRIPVGIALAIPCCLSALPTLPQNVPETTAKPEIRVQGETTKNTESATLPALTPTRFPVSTPAPIRSALVETLMPETPAETNVSQPTSSALPVPPAILPTPVPTLRITAPSPATPSPVKPPETPNSPMTPIVIGPPLFPSPGIREKFTTLIRTVVRPPNIPGQWTVTAKNDFGNLPIANKQANFVNRFRVDAGRTVIESRNFEVQPYGAVSRLFAMKDTPTLPLDKSVQIEIGVRAVRTFKESSVNFAAGYMKELKTSVLEKRGSGSPFLSSQGEIFWKVSRRQPDLLGKFEWLVGNLESFEKRNVIGTLRIEQGYARGNPRGITFGPEAHFAVGIDTQKQPANNRWETGGGFKFTIPVEKVKVDILGGVSCTNQYRGKFVQFNSGCGQTVSIRVQKSWGK